MITGPLIGLLTSEALGQIANRMDDTDQEISKLLSKDNVTEKDLEEAIRLAQNNETTLQKLYNSTVDALRQEQGISNANQIEDVESPVVNEFLNSKEYEKI